MSSVFNPPSSHGLGMPLGLTGATAATRYVGATASGAPASGTFNKGDFVIDQTGRVYVCTAAGSPGTWAAVGGGASLLLYDSTLGGDAAAIDTGANGIAQTADHLMVLIVARTSQAIVASSVTITLNNDSSAIYDRSTLRNTNTTVTGVTNLATAGWALRCPGDSVAAGVFGVIQMWIPAYRQTTAQKVMTATGMPVLDTSAANVSIDRTDGNYRSTTAISRLAATASSGNLRTGSRLSIYGF